MKKYKNIRKLKLTRKNISSNQKVLSKNESGDKLKALDSRNHSHQQNLPYDIKNDILEKIVYRFLKRICSCFQVSSQSN